MKNKLKLLTAFALISIGAANGQTGIGNTDPKATLDVTGTPATATTADGIIAPRLTGDELKAKDAVYLADQRGSYVYVTAAASPTTAKTANVTAAGYYYFDGTVWQKVASGSDVKWVNATLTSGETGAQYTGTPASTKVFVSNTGGVLIGKDNSVSGTPSVRSGLSVSTDYVTNVTGNINTLSEMRVKTGAAVDVEASRNSAIEDATNSTGFNRLVGSIDFANKTGSGNGNSVIASRPRASATGSASGSVTNFYSVKAETAINGPITVTNAYGVSAEMNAATALTQLTNVYGVNISGDLLDASTRAGLNRYGLFVGDVRSSNVQTGGQVFSIYTNTGVVSFGDRVEMRGTGALTVSNGTTAQRPATPAFGMVRYNSTIGRGEMYVNDLNGDGTQGDAGWRAF